jgi:spore maturation protein CgeB
MRSFEIPAIGACMVAEDTTEHREIFGDDGHAVRYFRSPEEAVSIVSALLRSVDARRALAAAAHARILNSRNSYGDRLRSMLGVAGMMQSPPSCSYAAPVEY